jgi:cell division FtsZ-interacting protein ZapD
VSQDVAPPEAKVSILVSPGNASLLLKAAKEIAQRGDFNTEIVNDFERQNPASKKLMAEVVGVFEQASESLAKEVKELLGADSK